MPNIKYIATTTKTDSIRGVGLRWTPGQIRAVTAQVAERLIVHPDTWIVVEGECGEPIELATDEKPVEEPLPVIDFHGMNKDALVEFADREYNEKIDKRLSESNIRHKVIALFGQKQAELG